MRNRRELIWKIVVIFIISSICILMVSIKNSKNRNQLEIIYISKSVDEKNEFWMALISGAKMAAKEYSANLTVVAPRHESDYEEQNKLIKDAINKNPDAILLSPSSYT